MMGAVRDGVTATQGKPQRSPEQVAAARTRMAKARAGRTKTAEKG
jgi:hypothetical protein